MDELDSIICQGKEMGTYVYIYSGGEPLVCRDDLIRLCEKHSDCAFLAFTNGTLIDDAFADEMLRVHNFVPAISIEGFEEATDDRRGKGTYRQVIQAMERLKARRLLFGISCCYTSKNVEVIGNEEYFDTMIEMGAKFAWFFTYNPGALTKIVDASGAHSTDLESPERACDYCGKCEKAAAAWAPVADELWASLPNKHGMHTSGKMAKKS